jgi:hypothetical protein
VPRISEFYGIVISMYYDDHAPPHFHAWYAGAKARIAIEGAVVIKSDLPPRETRLVRRWARLRRLELLETWNAARAEESLPQIEPLP